MKWFKEIKLVGFKDWFWFVFILKRNKFSYKLALLRYTGSDIILDRTRAHNISNLIGDENG